jgi:hypothetical protein
MAAGAGLSLLLIASAILLISPLASARIPLTGYFCGQCDANPKPTELVYSIHPAYTTVIFSFIGWDATGNVTNAWDCNSKACPKNFTLTPAMVSHLKVCESRAARCFCVTCMCFLLYQTQPSLS